MYLVKIGMIQSWQYSDSSLDCGFNWSVCLAPWNRFSVGVITLYEWLSVRNLSLSADLASCSLWYISFPNKGSGQIHFLVKIKPLRFSTYLLRLLEHDILFYCHIYPSSYSWYLPIHEVQSYGIDIPLSNWSDLTSTKDLRYIIF